MRKWRRQERQERRTEREKAIEKLLGGQGDATKEDEGKASTIKEPEPVAEPTPSPEPTPAPEQVKS